MAATALRRLARARPPPIFKKNVQKDIFFFSKTNNERAYAIHYKSIKNNPAVFIKINNKRAYAIQLKQIKKNNSAIP